MYIYIYIYMYTRTYIHTRGQFFGYFAEFSGAAGLAEDLWTWSPEGDARGCSPFEV